MNIYNVNKFDNTYFIIILSSGNNNSPSRLQGSPKNELKVFLQREMIIIHYV